jgi:quercetin dioxygenase-like cupin family protein
MTTDTEPERADVADRWEQRGFSCKLWVDAPGQEWVDFVHPVDELVMVVSGEVEFEFAGAVHRPRRGEELQIPAGTIHTVRNVGGVEARWLYGYHR